MALIAGLMLAFFLGHEAGERTSSNKLGPEQSRPSAIDIGFSQDMAVHHEQALLMSTLADTRANPAVKALADSILIGQSQEVGVLRGWLLLWGKPAASSSPMSWMPGGSLPMHGGMDDKAEMTSSPDSSMPGMASPEQLNELWTKSGNDFDVLFLQLMIRHHQGGVMMAQYAAIHGTFDALRQTAKVMVSEQAHDIGQMRALLKADVATPLPPP
jgi:uncharacterized protein (DUF305 family)